MYDQDYEDDYDYDSYGGHTGDPMLDREYERGGKGGGPNGERFNEYIPEPVKKFLVYFNDMIQEGNAFEISNLYENSFPKLTDQFFKSSSWPEADIVEPYVGGDQLFLTLYKELYYRHIYAR